MGVLLSPMASLWVRAQADGLLGGGDLLGKWVISRASPKGVSHLWPLPFSFFLCLAFVWVHAPFIMMLPLVEG